MASEATPLRELPLTPHSRALGAKMGSFAGWAVPLYYTTILEEHHCVRNSAGIFDISHMGWFALKGAEARKFLDRILSANLSRLAPGEAVYSLLTNESGGILDDVIVYQRDENDYFLIVNAATREKDLSWISRQAASFDLKLEDRSHEKIFLAVQGPQSEKIVGGFFKTELSQLKRFTFKTVPFKGAEIILARTGYTGEDGFEILSPVKLSDELWEGLLQFGEPLGLRPVGFGARDTLRLEARYLLYGQDMNDQTTPLEAGLAWAVDFKKEFIGSSVIGKQHREGISKRLIAFEVLARSIPRPHYSLYHKGRVCGEVTSGCFSPTLKKNIGLGYIDSGALPQEGLEIEIRGERFPCKAVHGPFYIGESLKRFSRHPAS